MSQLDTLWYTRCPVPTPLGIASQLGWIETEFARDGIHVRTLQDTNDPNLRESHFDHRLDNSFRQGGNIPAIWARSQGRDTKLIGLTWTNEAQVILVRGDSPLQRVSDLRGKRLGVRTNPQGLIDFWRATTIRAYVAALGVEGLSERDVSLVDFAQNQQSGSQRGWSAGEPEKSPEVVALLEGRVDAIFHKGSRGLELADSIGARVLYDVNTHPDPKVRVNNGSPRTFTVDAGLLERHPDVVTRLAKQVLLAGSWAEQNRKEAVEYVAKETFSSVDAVERAYGRNVNHALKTDLEPSSIAALSDFKDFLHAWKFIPNDFDVNSWIDARPLNAAIEQIRRESAIAV
ncbi:MAG TPA: ABC transporter substrate-binding protein [Polyangiaceae bacterium]|nr:ABC transporter substrate-binding protein [Polyangiaceae bacterium]